MGKRSQAKDLSLCSLRQMRPLLRFPRTPWTLSWQTRRHSQLYYSVTLFLGLLWPLAMFQKAPHHWTLLAVTVLRSPGIVTSRSSPLLERLALWPSTSWQQTESFILSTLSSDLKIILLNLRNNQKKLFNNEKKK